MRIYVSLCQAPSADDVAALAAALVGEVRWSKGQHAPLFAEAIGTLATEKEISAACLPMLLHVCLSLVLSAHVV